MSINKRQSQCVILLHGLARTHLSMRRMERYLKTSGYCVFNISYPSRYLPIDELAPLAINQGLEQCNQNGINKVHFVTHSMGGILVRQYLHHHKIPNLGRVVMLGPPNHGSEAADRLKHLPGYRLINGPAGFQLGTHKTDIPKTLGPVDFDLGVIAGKRSNNLFLSALLPGEDDGKVTVESTKIEGMTDFITLPISHTFMMQDYETLFQTNYFLDHGYFDHERIQHAITDNLDGT